MRVEYRKNGVTGNKIADKKVKYQIKLLCNYTRAGVQSDQQPGG